MTGGGTSGHVTPNIALFDILKQNGFEISYIGSKNGVEKELIKKENIPYYEISTGKLRRYLDKQNLSDIKKVLMGKSEAKKILSKIRPDIVFSKGGYVSCPVVWAAKSLKIPVVIHESDITPGLANKLSIPFATKVCYAFSETKKHLPKNKSVFTGLPIREELVLGDIERAKEMLGFDFKKPVLTIIGGSQGSVVLNRAVKENLDKLLEIFSICHICGKGNLDETLTDKEGYVQFEYLNEELKDVFSVTDLIVSRAGATAIFEILYAKIPNLLVPLSKKASRGDQILNAKSFEEKGYSKVLFEENLNKESFLKTLLELYNNKSKYIKNMEEAN